MDSAPLVRSFSFQAQNGRLYLGFVFYQKKKIICYMYRLSCSEPKEKNDDADKLCSNILILGSDHNFATIDEHSSELV
jgi:hypothetical protein